jgi:phosphoglycerate dehydrogenase-like enzyme
MKLAYLSKARPELLNRIDKSIPYVIVASGPDGKYSPEELAKVADVDAFIVSAEPVHDQILAAAKQLKIVQRLGVGYDSLDLEAAKRRGIPCCNVAGVNKEAVAEHTMGLILALAKNLREGERLTREAAWGEARLLTRRSFELKGKTLGILGFGAIGTNLARRAKAFEMKIVYNDVRKIDPKEIAATGAKFLEKPALFRTSDIVSIHTTLNPTTRGLVDAKLLGMMKPTALLTCAARGGIVDEAALRDVLNAGKIAGAGMDVFTVEPILPDNPLLQAKNLLMTSHLAGLSIESSKRGMTWALENVRRVVELGEKPQWVVNGL